MNRDQRDTSSGWDKDSRSIVISRDVKFDESKFPHRKDLDYKNPFADKKRRSISVKNRRKTTDESDTDTEEGLVIPSTSDSDDDHRPSHPAPPPPGAPPPVPPKNSPGSKHEGGKRTKTTRPDEKPSTTISPEPDTRGSVFGSTRPRYNLRPRKRHDIPKAGSSCQIGTERSDYLGDKISVGVARPSHVLGQSVPCDG